jgi:anti-sigma regulatory factor (Ser/Thr protein kinase)
VDVEDNDQRTLIDEQVTIRNIAELRTHVLRLVREAGLDLQRAEDFALAINEATTNAIEHAGGTGELTVIKDYQRCVIAEISDNGPGIPPGVKITLPPWATIGGRGLWLSEVLTDHIEIRTSSDGTTVRLEMVVNPQ